MIILHSTKKDKIFENCRVYDTNNKLLSYSNKRKIDWYVNKGIAIYKDATEKDIILLFEPKNKNIDSKSLISKENICYECGTNKNLTKHHVVPAKYVKYMSIEHKDNHRHNLVPLCTTHHGLYEDIANEYKIKLVNDYVPKYILDRNVDIMKIHRYNKSMKYLVDNNIDEVHINNLKQKIDAIKNRWFLGDDYDKSYINPTDYIVKLLGDDIISMIWRSHFLKNMNLMYADKEYLEYLKN